MLVFCVLQGLLKKHEVFETDFQVHRERCQEVQKEGEKLMTEVTIATVLDFGYKVKLSWV